VAEASDGQGALDEARKCGCEVVLLDIAMPGRGGMETLGQIRKERPDLPVLILSIYPEEQYAVRALRAGAAGYLTKESAPLELVEAIRKAAAGGKYVSTSLAEKLAYQLDGRGQRPPHETLSDREFQVMKLLASGRTVGQIAEELSLSVKTNGHEDQRRADLLRRQGGPRELIPCRTNTYRNVASFPTKKTSPCRYPSHS